MKICLPAGTPPRDNWLNALHFCCGSNRTGAETVKLLLDAGVDPNSKDPYGHTPLHEIIIGLGRERVVVDEAVKIVKLLLEAGADPHVLDTFGRTALGHCGSGLESRRPGDDRPPSRSDEVVSVFS